MAVQDPGPWPTCPWSLDKICMTWLSFNSNPWSLLNFMCRSWLFRKGVLFKCSRWWNSLRVPGFVVNNQYPGPCTCSRSPNLIPVQFRIVYPDILKKTRAEAYMWYYFYSRTWNTYNSQMWVTVIHTSHYLIVALLYPILLCLVTTAGRVVPTQLRHGSQRAAQGLPRTTTEDRMLSMSQAKKESTSLSPPLNDYCSDILIFLILV